MNARANAAAIIARMERKARPVKREKGAGTPTAKVFICPHCVAFNREVTEHRAVGLNARVCKEGAHELKRATMRRYYQRNRERIIARMGEYQKSRRSARRDYLRNYRHENAEAFRATRRRSYAKHAERNRARERARYHANKEKIAARRASPRIALDVSIIPAECW